MDDQKQQSDNATPQREGVDQNTEQTGQADTLNVSGVVVEHHEENDAQSSDLTADDVEKELLDEGGVEILKNGETYEEEHDSDESPK